MIKEREDETSRIIEVLFKESKGYVLEDLFFQLIMVLIYIKYSYIKRKYTAFNKSNDKSDKLFDQFIRMRHSKEQTNLWNELIQYDEYKIIENFGFKFSGILNTYDRSLDVVYRVMEFVDMNVTKKAVLDESASNSVSSLFNSVLVSYAEHNSKSVGESFTPPEITELLVKIIHPVSGESVYDPVCGSGSLLIKAFKEVENYEMNFSGQEINLHTAQICKMNMIINNIEKYSRIEVGDTIQNPKFVSDIGLNKFDVILANPPFGIGEWSYEVGANDTYKRFERGLPPRKRGEYAFILHSIESLKREADSRLAIVASNGALIRSGSEGEIRRKLVEENLLDAVIGLPSNLFYGTAISCNILVFKMNRKDKGVLFIDASELYYEKDRIKRGLSSEHIEKISSIYKDYKGVESISYLASYSELLDNDFNLSVSKYVNKRGYDKQIDIISELQEISELEHKLNKVQKEIQNKLEMFEMHFK